MMEPIQRDPAVGGLRIIYRAGETNFCPGCGRMHWLVGRTMAECAFCSTALPIEASGFTGIGTIRVRVGAEFQEIAE